MGRNVRYCKNAEETLVENCQESFEEPATKLDHDRLPLGRLAFRKPMKPPGDEWGQSTSIVAASNKPGSRLGMSYQKNTVRRGREVWAASIFV